MRVLGTRSNIDTWNLLNRSWSSVGIIYNSWKITKISAVHECIKFIILQDVWV